MQIPTPDELKRTRERLGLTQVEVARLAGISQSMVARIETGTVDPRVSTLQKVIQVLKNAERPTRTAKDVMCTPVYYVRSEDPIMKAVELMEERNISQLPVVEDGIPVGCISESAIINAIEEGKTSRGQIPLVKDCMESGFPMVPPDADLPTVVHLLQSNHAVLVIEKGVIRGVITKHDLIPLIA
ncbi:MAG: CBS domain-containing protein [Methanomicrobiales archaeon]|nr:CBS domain-containing protein [Methanomicrobiales archaeon]